LLCAIGLFNYFNRFNNALRMEPTKPGEGGLNEDRIGAGGSGEGGSGTGEPGQGGCPA
jgi:hypothetical protein